jgi:hypothetical protein
MLILPDLTGMVIEAQNLNNQTKAYFNLDKRGLQGMFLITAWNEKKLVTKKVILR